MVHFVDSPSDSVACNKSSRVVAQMEPANNISVEIQPIEELVFQSNRNGASATILVKNCGRPRIAFKIKTTSPEKYRVRPFVGTLAENETAEVVVTMGEYINPVLVAKHKFLVWVVVTDDSVDIPDGQIFKDVAPEDLFETKLRIRIENPSSDSVTNAVDDISKLDHMMDTIISMNDKLNDIMSKQNDLQKQVRESRMFLVITVFVIVAIFIYVIISIGNTTSLLLQNIVMSTHGQDEL